MYLAGVIISLLIFIVSLFVARGPRWAAAGTKPGQRHGVGRPTDKTLGPAAQKLGGLDYEYYLGSGEPASITDLVDMYEIDISAHSNTVQDTTVQDTHTYSYVGANDTVPDAYGTGVNGTGVDAAGREEARVEDHEEARAVTPAEIYNMVRGLDLNDPRAMVQFQFEYAWAIPTEQAVVSIADFINKNSKEVLSIGAGKGLWERLIAEHLRDIPFHITDAAPDGSLGHRNLGPNFTAVERLTSIEAAAKYNSADTLLTIWPPYNEDVAAVAATALKPRYIIYIGEIGGATADDAFHNLLGEYTKVYDIQIPNWRFIRDKCTIYKKY